MTAREVMRLSAVRQCCPGKRDCGDDCQGHMVDQQLAALREAGLAVADRKLLIEAHAVMRECGWHLATAAEPISDGVIEAACSEIEARFADMLDAQEDQR